MPTASQPKVRCRQIASADLDRVVDLLARGFPERPRRYWERGLGRQGARAVPPDCPRYGYLLESDGRLVGVILLIFTTVATDAGTMTRCNLSSWYVEPAFRSQASLLIFFALKHKHVTYVNISPAAHTWSTIEAQGFSRYCDGQFLVIPALNSALPDVEVRDATDMDPSFEITSPAERDLLVAHAGYGCLSVVCQAADGAHPFVFTAQPLKKGPFSVRCMQLVYCRDIAEFARFAGHLGRYLLKRGQLLVRVDANGPVPGLVGIYRDRSGRRYFKGPQAPRLGDLTFTELVLFGP